MGSGEIKRVGLVFSGGPAPGANAVIASAATAFRRAGCEVLGFMNGYSALEKGEPLEAPRDYFVFENHHLRGLRNSRGVLIGTARAHPGRDITSPADLDDPRKSAPLRAVKDALVNLGVDALVSIGGDGTLCTANFLHELGRRDRPGAKRVRIVHVPKTIDNDYRGIDFAFGFFTAVDVMAKALLNLRADAIATKSYYVVETMGRSAGWLAYGVAVAGEAHMVVSVEDVLGDLAIMEDGTPKLDVDALANRIVDLVSTREASGKAYGTLVLAEGLAEMLPTADLANAPRDQHGNVALGRIEIGKLVAARAAEHHRERTGRAKKITGVQLGYESRCAAPHAFDVMLGSQLGVGAHRALVERDLDGHMVTVAGQLELAYVPFSEIIDPETFRVDVRRVKVGSDLHRLAHAIETRLPS